MKTTRNELKLRADKCPIKRFKAFIGKADTQATLCADTGIEVIGWSGFDASDLNAKCHRVELARFIAAADPETILALLAELEAKDKRITTVTEEREFWRERVDGAEKEREEFRRRFNLERSCLEDADKRIAELEAKLATPVRLPAKVSAQDMRETFNYLMDAEEAQAAANGFNQGLMESRKLLHEQGFTVEGDE